MDGCRKVSSAWTIHVHTRKRCLLTKHHIALQEWSVQHVYVCPVCRLVVSNRIKCSQFVKVCEETRSNHQFSIGSNNRLKNNRNESKWSACKKQLDIFLSLHLLFSMIPADLKCVKIQVFGRVKGSVVFPSRRASSWCDLFVQRLHVDVFLIHFHLQTIESSTSSVRAVSAWCVNVALAEYSHCYLNIFWEIVVSHINTQFELHRVLVDSFQVRGSSFAGDWGLAEERSESCRKPLERTARAKHIARTQDIIAVLCRTLSCCRWRLQSNLRERTRGTCDESSTWKNKTSC